ncbi:WD40-repeat-containing domain protein [Spinellus fusiger]|nr:WD40-repeat-containing domain protein [Spinellus fusiger]
MRINRRPKDNFVHVYYLNDMSAPFKTPVKTLISPHALQDLIPDAYVINAIKLGVLLDKEVLMTVADNGHVCIWRTDALDKPPFVLSHDVVSTWGIALHGSQGLVAVSTNDKKITVFNILKLTESTLLFENKKRTVKRAAGNILGGLEKCDLIGHEHNIPNIDFNETGEYLVSCSIDKTCRVWDIAHQKVVTTRRLPSRTQESQSW